MIESSAPGKLFIVGEYAVVEPGEPAVLVAVDRYIHLQLTELAAPAPFETSEHVRAAIGIVDELRLERGIEKKFFSISISSELETTDGRKFGLGSSAAVTVAVIQALNTLYSLRLTAVERYKLALLATIQISPKASGGDLAASTFGGWLRYSSPDRVALRTFRSTHTVTETLACRAWQGFSAEHLSAPTNLEFLVGWTGSPASTTVLVDRAAVSGSERVGREGDAEAKRVAFFTESRVLVELFARNLTTDLAIAASAISRARRLLQDLGASRDVEIETDSLRELCDIAEHHHAAAKPSGAGGGDCGIVLADRDSDIAAILREWENRGIRRLELGIHAADESLTQSPEGVNDER